jgi:hypothetical protein
MDFAQNCRFLAQFALSHLSYEAVKGHVDAAMQGALPIFSARARADRMYAKSME